MYFPPFWNKVYSKVKHRRAIRAEPMTFFFSQYGEICPDNLWDFTPPVSPTLTPQPPPPPPHHHHQKDLVVIHYKTW